MTPVVKSPVATAEEQEEYAWEALDEMEGQGYGEVARSEQSKRKPWLPDGMIPVLEELPKWSLLASVLQEIEEELMRQESLGNPPAACESCLRSIVRSGDATGTVSLGYLRG
jgi:hypothetical protein